METPIKEDNRTFEEITTEMWGAPAYPRIYVYKKRENAEYVRDWIKSEKRDQDWHQLILHRDDPLPKGLSRVTYLDHPNEDSVESHRLEHQR